ncbi:hypothetical protein Acid345_3568 [Candidatus Koribacter versatilis Ellin345]|uniref:Lipocalin-like domain-containing protein n=1 Tax=Koribacter versatilis (strain Ellin345) TaxID=204669 RepID=Q1IKN1_KORVE|nr:hypothetical protein [Candidatus Koribacter versatilis]ABF42569.1 hypothetical protein Acid345_3568 [Candidatus Koribacter versatilis Ellin345]
MKWTLAFLILSGALLTAQQVPATLQGKWVVKRELPTRTISCWGEKEAQQVIGTEIEYTEDSFRWKDHTIHHPKITVRRLTGDQYHDEYSSPASDGSQVDFTQLGIKSATAEQIEFGHPPAHVVSESSEIPGDVVLIKHHDAIVFSVCNVYFEAERAQPRKR